MNPSSSAPRRYSTIDLPSYSYVPGFTPHPVSDPRGHRHRRPAQAAAPLDPDAWPSSDGYRYAIDLFNYGYYWEAHEAWETLWHAAGRRGALAAWLKALIMLAAAGVKLREGNARGARRHANRALELLGGLPPAPSATAAEPNAGYCGLPLPQVETIAAEVLAAAAEPLRADPSRLLQHSLVLQF
jgi:hypothetical protein